MIEKELEYFKKLESDFNSMGIDKRIDILLRCMMPKWKNAIISKYEKDLYNHHISESYPLLSNLFIGEVTSLDETIDIMRDEGLLYVNKLNEPMPTSKAHRLFESGGWLANINQTKTDRKHERNNIRAAILTNITVLITSSITTFAIVFNAYTDNEALSIARKDHYLQHIMQRQQEESKSRHDTVIFYSTNPILHRADSQSLKNSYNK